MHEKISITANGEFCDPNGNILQLRGVNLDPSVKIPSIPSRTTHSPIVDNKFYEEAEDVSFINQCLPLDQVDEHINRIKSLGFNTIRLLFTWEAIEHKGPGIYDFGYIDYLIELIRKIDLIGGIYVYLDPHQDAWSRFCGGSGAPLWTLYCAGFQPNTFKYNEAAILHNHYIDPKTGKEFEDNPYPKMLWPTNYFRLACETMFTLFYAGKHFAPKCIINGINIQDYLQEHLTNAVIAVYSRIQQNAPELFTNNCIIGLETMNEPNNGYIGEHNLSMISKDQDLKLGNMPTGFQTFLLGEGIPQTVDKYDITIFGPKKVGATMVNEEKVSAWLTKDERDKIDSKYGWKRDESWLPHQCIWRLHDVWEIPPLGNPILLKPNYFTRVEGDESQAIINEEYFINNQFLDYYRLIYSKFRDIDKERFIFLQPPVFKPPPKLKNTNLLDGKTVVACHFYDGMSLMFKTWNKRMNVDTFGVVRGRYRNPALGVVLGENNIRKSIRKQLKQMKDEVTSTMGSNVPTFFTEIGMPFDMDDKKAYQDGNYIAQTAALDALQYGLEGSNLSYSLWCYCFNNSHEWGDDWNNEDFSIWSPEDASKFPNEEKLGTVDNDIEKFGKLSLDYDDDLSLSSSCISRDSVDYNGFRALNAILRPYPFKIHGSFINAEFDLASMTYTLEIVGNDNSKETPTLIFLPSHHFPLETIDIQTTSGRFTYDPTFQILKWFHDKGNQQISISSNDNSKGDGCIIV